MLLNMNELEMEQMLYKHEVVQHILDVVERNKTYSC